MAFRIEQITAFVAVGDDDEEGVIGIETAQGWLPFVAADERRVTLLRPYAEAIAHRSGKKVILLRFTGREELEEIGTV